MLDKQIIAFYFSKCVQIRSFNWLYLSPTSSVREKTRKKNDCSYLFILLNQCYPFFVKNDKATTAVIYHLKNYCQSTSDLRQNEWPAIAVTIAESYSQSSMTC